jgi:hypothetical protein
MRALCPLVVKKFEKALVVMGSAQKLEPDPSVPYGTDHRGHFYRRFPFEQVQLQVKDVVNLDHGVTLHHTPAERDDGHSTLATQPAT